MICNVSRLGDHWDPKILICSGHLTNCRTIKTGSEQDLGSPTPQDMPKKQGYTKRSYLQWTGSKKLGRLAGWMMNIFGLDQT